jgi:hypothetical protein|tara:strand:- start:19 stop:237 length:219 start_codon:yes stop_codon:yes gene_type:complete
MAKVIIYPFENGIAELYTTGEMGQTASIHHCIPVGAKYKIIDTTDLPDDTFRDAWEFDFTTNFDGISEGNGL